MHLEGLVAERLAGEQFADDVGIAGSGYQGRKPIQSRDNAVFDLAGGYVARPANDAGHAEATLERRAFAAGERGLSAVRPGEVLGAVVGGEDHDGVVVEAL